MSLDARLGDLISQVSSPSYGAAAYERMAGASAPTLSDYLGMAAARGGSFAQAQAAHAAAAARARGQAYDAFQGFQQQRTGTLASLLGMASQREQFGQGLAQDRYMFDQEFGQRQREFGQEMGFRGRELEALMERFGQQLGLDRDRLAFDREALTSDQALQRELLAQQLRFQGQQNKKDRRGSFINSLLGIGATGIGAILGGPAGAALGWKIGGYLGI